jgi:hypothetical protein
MMKPDELKELGIDVLQDLPGNRVLRVRCGLLSAHRLKVFFLAVSALMLVMLCLGKFVYPDSMHVVTYLGLFLYVMLLFASLDSYWNYEHNPYHIEIEADIIDIQRHGRYFLSPPLKKTEYLDNLVSVSVKSSVLFMNRWIELGFMDYGAKRLLQGREKRCKLEAIADILNRWIEEEKAALNENTEANDVS